MPHYSVATTKDQLSSLLRKVVAGEEVIITLHGKPVAEINPVDGQAMTARTRAAAMRQLREWQEGAAPRLREPLPLERFSDWLNEDE